MIDLYVSKYGKDSNNGSKESPFLTVDFAISQVVEDSIIHIGGGEFDVEYMQSLSKTGVHIIFEGVYNKTIFNIKKTDHGFFKGEVDFIRIVFKPSDDLYGDTRVISYTSCKTKVNYYNCVFRKSDNGNYPTFRFFYFHYNTEHYDCNKGFYNCLFTGNMSVGTYGSVRLSHCATNYTYFIADDQDTPNGCISNVKYNDSSYILTNEDNSLYGVYSGTYSWGKCLIKSNGLYYSILNNYYNDKTSSYTPITSLDFDNQSFILDDLFSEITIGNETFKPIDKFENIQLVYNQKFDVRTIGVKSKSELIVANGNIDLSIALAINSITLTANETDSKIRVAISVDKGETWCSYSNGTLTTLNVNIPLKKYNSMTDEEKSNYDAAKEEILANGIDVATFNGLLFDDLFSNTEFVRFAYAFEIQNSLSVAEIDKLAWDFDSQGVMRKLNDSEYIVDKYKKSVIVTPLIDTDILETNIVI